MSSHSFSVGRTSPISAPRGDETATQRTERDSVLGVGLFFRPHIADQVAKILADEGIAFKDLADFGYALARHGFGATDNEDEFFGLHPHN